MSKSKIARERERQRECERDIVKTYKDECVVCLPMHHTYPFAWYSCLPDNFRRECVVSAIVFFALAIVSEWSMLSPSMCAYAVCVCMLAECVCVCVCAYARMGDSPNTGFRSMHTSASIATFTANMVAFCINEWRACFCLCVRLISECQMYMGGLVGYDNEWFS